MCCSKPLEAKSKPPSVVPGCSSEGKALVLGSPDGGRARNGPDQRLIFSLKGVATPQDEWLIGHRIREYVSSQTYWMFPSTWSTFLRYHFLHPLSYHTLEFRERKWAWVAYTLHLNLPSESERPQRERICAFLLHAQRTALPVLLKEGLIPGPVPGSFPSTNTDLPSPELVFSVIEEVLDLTSGFCLFFWFPNNMSLISELMSEHRLTWL